MDFQTHIPLEKENSFGHHKSCILATQPQKAINCRRNELLEQVMCALATLYNIGSGTAEMTKAV